MLLKAIYAANIYNVIGDGNSMPWHIPEDLTHFKQLTQGGVCIMGRRTWNSLPDSFRPLPNRTNVIVTRDKLFKVDGAIVRHDLDKTIDEFMVGDKQVWIIGGGEILSSCWGRLDHIERTVVFNFKTDGTMVPPVTTSDWVKTNEHPTLDRTDRRKENDYLFQTWVRKVTE